MPKLAAAVAREVRKALPAMVFFLVLFHLLALTKAVALDGYQLTTLRAVGATLGALIVAKAILVVEALPLARLSHGRRALRVLWKTLLYAVVVLAFRVLEELVPQVIRHRDFGAGLNAMVEDVAWPLFFVLTLWIVAGLLLYTLATELAHAVGSERVRELLFGRHG